MASHLTVFSTYGVGAGSTRVRIYNWLDHLDLDATRYEYLGTSKLGLGEILRNPRTTLQAEWGIRRLPSLRHDLGVVFVSRRASPFSAGNLERQLLTQSRRGIYDFDDALYLERSGSTLEAKAWRRSVESAEVVIAGNETLATAALEYNDNVVHIPSCVEPADYPRKTDYTVSTPTAVWLGSPSTEKHLAIAQDALLQMHDELGMNLVVVSGGSAPLGPLEVMTKRVAWGSEGFLESVAGADVGIMPLIDNEFSRGKCAYKLLEYGAIGLPMIGSPVGANEYVLKGALGWSPRTATDWVDSLREAFSEGSVSRSNRGQMARWFVQKEFSYGAWAGRWYAAVQGQATS